ncbi:3-deoxy-7-phosphoheptulonate synthase [bacterium]|nr:3-deoxy-7-phosphoheptulonate synthase [bacterium]
MTKIPTKLDEIRAELDCADEELLSALRRRMELVEHVAAEKLAHPQTSLRDKNREKELLAALQKKARERGLNPYYVGRIFNDIIEYSMDEQQRLLSRADAQADAKLVRVGYQGVEGAYSFLAANKYFARQLDHCAFVGFRTFREVVAACEAGDLDFAVLPIENTIAGSINATYRLLDESSLSVVGEEVWQVVHCLIGLENVPLGHIRHVASHPQALLQCGEFLSQLTNCTIESFTDTAEAVRRVKERQDITHAAIASEDAADLYGLAVVKRDIADQRENYTKFVVVSKKAIAYDRRIPCKVSFVLMTDHTEGALLSCLRPFHDHGLNLVKLESRPMLHVPWEYQFFIDVEGHLDDPKMSAALDEVRQRARHLKILGCYPIRAKGFDAVSVPPEAEPFAPTGEAAPEEEPKPAKPAPYKLAARVPGRKDTQIRIGDAVIGGGGFTIIAGPCAVESKEQIGEAARIVRERGGQLLRGGVFKPRSSPYAFQGMGYEGLDILVEAGRTVGLPVVTEVLHPNDVAKVAAKADMLQIGARNMQNFSLLAEVGRVRRPVLLKRGMMASVEELLLAAEYILAGGNTQVVLCERGIRTFETATRNTLDLQAVPVLKKLTHLPVIVDPSHAAGDRTIINAMALSAMTAGADGIIVEVHPHPDEALCDGPQALTPELFADLTAKLRAVGKALGIED